MHWWHAFNRTNEPLYGPKEDGRKEQITTCEIEGKTGSCIVRSHRAAPFSRRRRKVRELSAFRFDRSGERNIETTVSRDDGRAYPYSASVVTSHPSYINRLFIRFAVFASAAPTPVPFPSPPPLRPFNDKEFFSPEPGNINYIILLLYRIVSVGIISSRVPTYIIYVQLLTGVIRLFRLLRPAINNEL